MNPQENTGKKQPFHGGVPSVWSDNSRECVDEKGKAEDQSLGNFHIKSLEIYTEHIVLPNVDKNDPKTLGALLSALQGSENAYSQNMATAERKKGGESYWWKTQAAILVFRPDPSEWPGVDVLEAICQAESGHGLTAENLRKIRGRLALVRTPAQVDSMSVQEVVDAYRQITPATNIKAAQNVIAGEGMVAAGNTEAVENIGTGQKTPDTSKTKLFWPSLIWSILFVGISTGMAYCACLWGQGDNPWQKILASWPYFVAGWAVCLGGFLFHSGKAGGRLFKRWKGED